MINKKLLEIVPNSKKFIFISVLLKLISLFSNITLIFFTARTITLMKINFFNIGIAFLAICLNFVSTQLASVFSCYASRNVKITLRKLIYQKILRLGASFQDKKETAKVLQLAVEGVEQLEIYFGQYLPQFFYSLIASFSLFILLSFINLKIAIILFLCVPLIPVSIILVQKIARKILSKYWDEYGNLADNFLENIQGLTTLFIYKADGYKQKKMAEEAEKFRKVTMKVLSMQLNSIIVMDLIAYGGAALGITAAIIAFHQNILDLEKLIICILVSADFFIPLRRLGSFFHTAMNGITASKNIFEILNYVEETDGKILFPDTKKQNLLLECKDTAYSYGSKKVLCNFDMRINSGSFTAFVGKSGSGKSTLAKIISGINRNYEGSVKISGIELKDISSESLYKNVSYISHRDWIFKGSVRETLLEGKSNAADSEMWQVLEKVQLSEFCNAQNGLETEILENASNLSSGQKQRLSIARALLHNTKIIIFDEATSNIDVESEKAIIQLLHQLKKEKTIFMISHREENCIEADNFFYFDNGKITTIEKQEENK